MAGPPNFCVKKLKMKAFQLLLHPLKNALRLLQFGICIVIDICDTGITTPLKNALRLLQFGMCIVIDICDTGGREGVFSKMFSPGPVQTKGLVNLLISYPILNY